MRRPLTKELLILIACSLPVLVQYAIMDSDDATVWRFFAEVAAIYAATAIVRGIRISAGRRSRTPAMDAQHKSRLRVEIEIRGQKQTQVADN